MDELRIREWHRGSPACIVIHFHRDITNEEIEAMPKALMAALASPARGDAPLPRQFCPHGYWKECPECHRESGESHTVGVSK